MVRIDNHSVVLVDAKTKKLLPEYMDSNGQVWVEGKASDEFLVQVASHTDMLSIAYPILVDGVLIPIKALLLPGGKCWVGASRTCEKAYDCTAFRFTTPNATNNMTMGIEGTVNVTFVRGERTHLPSKKEGSTDWTPTPQPENTTMVAGGLVSEPGQTKIRLVNQAKAHWKRCEHLNTITLRYCERSGLIARGIIPTRVNAIQAPPSQRPFIREPPQGGHSTYGPNGGRSADGEPSAKRSCGEHFRCLNLSAPSVQITSMHFPPHDISPRGGICEDEPHGLLPKLSDVVHTFLSDPSAPTDHELPLKWKHEDRNPQLDDVAKRQLIESVFGSFVGCNVFHVVHVNNDHGSPRLDEIA